MAIIIETGKSIHQNTLKKIIQNPKYKGYYTGGLSTVVDYRSKKRNFNDRSKWKIYKAYEKVPPIVSEELWEKANQKLLSRSKSAKLYQKHQTKYSLSGKLYCDKHKCGFVRKVRHYKNRTDEIYWYCSYFHKTGRKNCLGACFKQDDLYNVLLSVFKTYEIYKEEICEELLVFYNSLSKIEENDKQEIKLQNELDTLNKRQDKLLDFALDGILSKGDLKLKKSIIERQIQEIELELEQLEKNKIKEQKQKYNSKVFKDKILKELNITKENLENYIEELLDKIIVIDKENQEGKLISLKKEKQKMQMKKQNEEDVELKIILTGSKIVSIGNPSKTIKISQLAESKGTY